MIYFIDTHVYGIDLQTEAINDDDHNDVFKRGAASERGGSGWPWFVAAN